jgi:hypothetical protein
MFVYPPGFSLIASPAAHVALAGRADAAPKVVKLETAGGAMLAVLRAS